MKWLFFLKVLRQIRRFFVSQPAAFCYTVELSSIQSPHKVPSVTVIAKNETNDNIYLEF